MSSGATNRTRASAAEIPSGRATAAPPAGVSPEALESIYVGSRTQILRSLRRTLPALDAADLEDSLQDSWLRALLIWPERGVPANPVGWLVEVARNRLRDLLRQRGRWTMEEWAAVHQEPRARDYPVGIPGEMIRIFSFCSHPGLMHDSQLALALRLGAGLPAERISSLLGAPVSAIEKRIARAKHRLRTVRADVAVCGSGIVAQRLPAILECAYLALAEARFPPEGAGVDDELIHELIHGLHELTRVKMTDSPDTHSVAALACFAAARHRSAPDAALIEKGARHLAASRAGARTSNFGLEAELAGLHCQAGPFDAKQREHVAALYEEMARRCPDPVLKRSARAARDRAGMAPAGSPEPSNEERQTGPNGLAATEFTFTRREQIANNT